MSIYKKLLSKILKKPEKINRVMVFTDSEWGLAFNISSCVKGKVKGTGFNNTFSIQPNDIIITRCEFGSGVIDYAVIKIIKCSYYSDPNDMFSYTGKFLGKVANILDLFDDYIVIRSNYSKKLTELSIAMGVTDKGYSKEDFVKCLEGNNG